MIKKSIIFALILLAMAMGCQTDNNDLNYTAKEYCLTISLPNTKTSLGGEPDSNKYPVYWSEGDCIAVNGVASQESVINQSDRGRAQFKFGQVLRYPYKITYPYTATTTESAPKVVFSAEQDYVENSTQSGVLPMYGHVTDSNSAITLNHLASVLRLPVVSKSEGVVLERVVVTAKSDNIAGEFAVDCTTGTIAACETATNTITYTLPDNFTLSTSESRILYIALPAIEIGECEIRFIAKGDLEMVCPWGNKSLKAGVVRQFSTITFKNGTSALVELPAMEEQEGELIVKRYVSGYVKDSNGVPIGGVAVSDGFSVTTTDSTGHYAIEPSSDAWYIYVTTPAEYAIETDSQNLPCFYKKHSPQQDRYDFTLTPLTGGKEEKFALFVITDVHIDFQKDGTERFSSIVVPHINSEYDALAAQGIPCYGINLGDIITTLGDFDGTSYRSSFLSGVAQSKVPFFTLFGNHDCCYFTAANPLITDERNSTTNLAAQREHEDIFGPVNYSFDRGDIHIIGMRNTMYPDAADYLALEYGFTDEQVQWLKEDLALVPKSKPILFCVHVPIFNSTYKNYDVVHSMLDKFDSVRIISGHNHYNRNITHNSFQLYPNSNIYEENICSVSGPVWLHDIAGDGSPRGYKVYINEGGAFTNSYYLSYGEGANARNKQMRLYRGDAKFGAAKPLLSISNPNGTKGYYAFNYGENVLLANVFNANNNWSIKVYENGVDMGEMTKIAYKNVQFGDLTGDGQFATPYQAATGVLASVDFYFRGYMLGKCGHPTIESGCGQGCFHLYQYTIQDPTATIKVVATDEYNNSYEESTILGDTTF